MFAWWNAAQRQRWFFGNLAEREVRLLKVQQKVSGGFRYPASTHAFCPVRGVLSTARKNGISATTALTQTFAGSPYFHPCLAQYLAV